MHIVLSHGLESGPEATKVTALAAVAEALGHSSERPDYRGVDSPQARLSLLLERIRGSASPVLLAGSSMGAYISALASLEVDVEGLFLLAPPVGVDRLSAMSLRCAHVSIVHGWRDELIDPQAVVGLARQHSARLLLVDDDHRLGAHVDDCAAAFRTFLEAVQ